MNNENKKFLLGHMKTIKGVNSCASIPNSADNRVILLFTDISGNIVDELGKKLIKRWMKITNDFRSWYRSQVNFKLGKTLPISVQTDTAVLCILCLNNNVMDLPALKDGMILAGRWTSENKYNVHLNKINSNWLEIESMLTEYFVKSDVNVTIYENT